MEEEATTAAWYANFGDTVDNAFFFVVDKILDLQGFFIRQAWNIGYVVLLIAILSTALNYALTGTGLKENIVKILKAVVFFVIVMVAYPAIISFITSWTYDMARQSIYPSVKEHFDEVVDQVETRIRVDVSTGQQNAYTPTGSIGNKWTFDRILYKALQRDNKGLFSGIERTREHSQMSYTAVAPAAVIKVILVIAGECIKYTDTKGGIVPEFSRILKGLICAFFAMLTGVFALLEYLVCFLEFMLVASVGVILFPLSLWEGSKFMAEKFVGAILGFFIKLLFCNIAIFLMLYGFVSLFYIISANGFTGGPDHIIFIIFTCLLFFFICKSIPGIAQSLLTGTPSLSAAGAIGAVGGMVAAAGATMHMAKNMGNAGKAIGGAVAGGTAKTAFAAHGLMSQASAAAGAVRSAGGGIADQAGAFGSSVLSTGRDAFSAGALGLTRSLTGGGNGGANPHSWQEYFNKTVDKNTGEQLSYGSYLADRKQEGKEIGHEYANKHGIK